MGLGRGRPVAPNPSPVVDLTSNVPNPPLSLIAASAVLACGAMVWNFDQPPRAFLRVQDAPAGSSKAQITRLLGEPATISDNGRTFVYTRPFSWGILYVYFDRYETLTHYRYDR